MTIYNTIKVLQNRSFSIIIKLGNSNIYCWNVNIVWQSSADNKQYASFACAVYVIKDKKNKKSIFQRFPNKNI